MGEFSSKFVPYAIPLRFQAASLPTPIGSLKTHFNVFRLPNAIRLQRIIHLKFQRMRCHLHTAHVFRLKRDVAVNPLLAEHAAAR